MAGLVLLSTLPGCGGSFCDDLAKTVGPAPAPVLLPPNTSYTVPQLVVNNGATIPVTNTGGPIDTSVLDLGAFPNGMDVHPDGTIFGTPTVFGDFPVVIKSCNAAGCSSAPADLKVLEFPPVVLPPAGAILPAPEPGVQGWQLNGAASFIPVSQDGAGSWGLRLTPAGTGRLGTAFWTTAIDARNLTVTFDAAMTGGTGGEGLSLILADAGQGMAPGVLGGQPGGAGGIRGLSLVLDTFPTGPGEPPVPFIGLTDGSEAGGFPVWLGLSTAIPDLRSTHHVQLAVAAGEVTVTVDGVALFRRQLPVPARAYLGFGASTGTATDVHDVFNITVNRP